MKMTTPRFEKGQAIASVIAGGWGTNFGSFTAFLSLFGINYESMVMLAAVAAIPAAIGLVLALCACRSSHRRLAKIGLILSLVGLAAVALAVLFTVIAQTQGPLIDIMGPPPEA